MKKIEKIVDIETGQERFIERDETADEKRNREENEKLVAELKSQEDANRVAKAAILEKLGITENEAKLLLS